ncbi:3-dehydroquinate synthase [Pedobacter sp. HMF7647]|uniref:3-dehydroquinate synthase n=1 Tax=Hufsiella arboris TaxID=2695275 RepID=A0A7K1YCD7_9SPHI|nr:3-dehydroquinate synthase [Hufsiella arboris]MXV52041.1 3-dehydroquinate synthase [Hufsiella arboris]
MQPIVSDQYSVFFDDTLSSLRSFISESNYSKIFFLCDRITSEKCLPYVVSNLPDLTEYDIIEVDEGEENKNIDYCIGIWNMLLDFGADRNSLVINVGGGVITDMGGFAAATYKRGIDFVQVPTTLLSQVDASVGGKTGIDLGSVKNIIGTFTLPKAVFISTRFLETLNRRELISGFAEIIKHGLIYDRSYFELISETYPLKVGQEIIYRSVAIKNEVVTIDPKEKGLRKILNFGHTIGHAVESYFLDKGKNALLHGEAIAIGMICEAFLSHSCNNLPKEDLNLICQYLCKVFPVRAIDESVYPDLISVMQNDKKNEKDKIGFALLSKIGKCDFNIYPDEKQIIESLGFYNDLLK